MNKMNKVFTTIYAGSLAIIGATIASCYYKDSPLEEGVNKFVGKVKQTFSNKDKDQELSFFLLSSFLFLFLLCVGGLHEPQKRDRKHIYKENN